MAMAEKKTLLESELAKVTGGTGHSGLLKNIGQVLTGTSEDGQIKTNISGSVSNNGISISFGNKKADDASVSPNGIQK